MVMVEGEEKGVIGTLTRREKILEGVRLRSRHGLYYLFYCSNYLFIIYEIYKFLFLFFFKTNTNSTVYTP